MRDPESDLSISIAMSDIIDVKPAPPEPPKSSIITFDEFSVKLKDMDLHEEDDDEDPVYLHAIEVERVVYDFVQELLLEVMEGSDNRNAENIRRDRLDKTKLFEELRQTANAYMIEKSTNVLLNNRINEYYKRGRNTRVFAKLSAFDESRFYNRYMYALTLVDRLKDRVEQAKFQQSCTLNKVFFDLHSSQMVTTIMEERLEKKVRRTLLRPDMEHLPRFVDREIRLMNAKRREISDTRLGLITRKHTLGHILNKIKELETVGINNFIAIQNEVVAVEKKIEGIRGSLQCEL
ncbi:hypothetical protein KR018_011168 [Drosophila ironensis]|nr:hypothetical protein KR018_011168 [Drosophila ironensis]